VRCSGFKAPAIAFALLVGFGALAYLMANMSGFMRFMLSPGPASLTLEDEGIRLGFDGEESAFIPWREFADPKQQVVLGRVGRRGSEEVEYRLLFRPLGRLEVFLWQWPKVANISLTREAYESLKPAMTAAGLEFTRRYSLDSETEESFLVRVPLRRA
jgi:hypothetical protein